MLAINIIKSLENGNPAGTGFDLKGGHAYENIVSGDILDPNIPGFQSTIIKHQNGHIAYDHVYIKTPSGKNTIGETIIEFPHGSNNFYKRKKRHTIWKSIWDDQRIKEEMAFAFGKKVEYERTTLDSNTGRYLIKYRSYVITYILLSIYHLN